MVLPVSAGVHVHDATIGISANSFWLMVGFMDDPKLI